MAYKEQLKQLTLTNLVLYKIIDLQKSIFLVLQMKFYSPK